MFCYGWQVRKQPFLQYACFQIHLKQNRLKLIAFLSSKLSLVLKLVARNEHNLREQKRPPIPTLHSISSPGSLFLIRHNLS